MSISQRKEHIKRNPSRRVFGASPGDLSFAMRNALTIASTTSSSNEKPGVALPSLARQDDTANRTTSKRAFARAIEASAKLDVASPDAVLVSRTPTSASKRNVLHAMAAGNRSARGLSATEAASTICTEETFGAPQPLTRRPSSAGDHPLPKKFFSSPGLVAKSSSRARMSSALPTRSSSCRGPASMQPHARTLAAILHADRASDSGASSSHVPEYSAQCCSPPGAPSRTGAARQRWQTAALQVRSAAAVKEAGLAIAGGRVKGQLSVMQSQTDAARKMKADWWVDVADSGLREKETAQATMKGSDAPSAQSGTSVTQEPPESDPEDINVPGMVFKSKVARASRTPSSRGVNYTAMATLSNRVQSLLDRSTHGGPASVRLAKLANGRC